MPVPCENREPGFLEVCSCHEWGTCVVRGDEALPGSLSDVRL